MEKVEILNKEENLMRSDLEKQNLIGITLLELEEKLAGIFSQRYQTLQLFEWIYSKKEKYFKNMTNLSKEVREILSENYCIKYPQIIESWKSGDDSIKYLLLFDDGLSVEVVKIKEEDHYTFCLSTQVGCPLGCTFCATGKSGYKRNLRVPEIVGSAMCLREDITAGLPINIVFMGMGEPLLNYTYLLDAIRILTDKKGMAIPFRRITVSTAGVSGKIKELSSYFDGIGIAFSINSTINEKRSRLMPVNRKYPLADIINELSSIRFTRNNPLTLEYVLLADDNDSNDEAENLAIIAKKLGAKINVIPYNSVAGIDCRTPSESVINNFIRILNKHSVPVTVRRSKGADISAACGQLILRKQNRHAEKRITT
jgi:23S rRNA (adenine2503-C2)-methyltransferase